MDRRVVRSRLKVTGQSLSRGNAGTPALRFVSKTPERLVPNVFSRRRQLPPVSMNSGAGTCSALLWQLSTPLRVPKALPRMGAELTRPTNGRRAAHCTRPVCAERGPLYSEKVAMQSLERYVARGSRGSSASRKRKVRLRECQLSCPYRPRR